MVKRFIFHIITFWLFSIAAWAQTPPQLQQPENNSRDLPTTIQFSWSPVDGADTYQIQISESSDFSTTVFDNNTSSTSIELAIFSRETQYFWRVRAGDRLEVGLTVYSDWSTVWNFTTVEEAPDPPEPVSPANGATGISTTPVLDWNASPKAESYRVQVSQNQDFSAILIDSSGLSATELQLSDLGHSARYYWRVRANNTGGASGWSEASHFTTVEEPPAVPELVSPADGSDNHPTEVTLEWNSAERAETYHFQLSENSDFSSTIYDRSGLSETSFQVSGLDKTTTYFWRVRAANPGGSSEWSQVRSFTTVPAAPPPPVLVSPENGATDTTTTPTLDWNPAERADAYDFQVSTNSSFSNLLINQHNVTSTEYRAQLEGHTTYYWRVRAHNEDGTSDWSESWNFTTEHTESSISISEPRAGDIWKAGQSYTIRWASTNNIEQVDLEVSVSGSSTEWVTIAERLEASDGTFDWVVPNSSSTEVRIRLSASDGSEITATSQPFAIYPSSYALDHRFGFEGTDANDYRLIALPAGTDNVEQKEVFEGTAGSDWRVFDDNGQTQDHLVEYTDSASFKFRSGRGYWAISRNDAGISKTVPSVPLENDSVYSVSLHEGWNIISNPFIIPIPWRAVQNANGISGPLWSFEGSHVQTDQMEVYKGYYYFNRDSLDQLKIPYSTETGQAREKPASPRHLPENMLTLGVGNEDKISSQVEIVHLPDTESRAGDSFQFAPPAPFQDYRITMDVVDSTYPGYPLYKRTLGRIDNLTEIELTLDAIPGRQVRIEVSGQQTFSPFALHLVDLSTGKRWDLHQTDEVLVKPGNKQTRYQLLIGTPEEVNRRIGQSLPSVVSLAQNYPNPFSRRTVIEYSIPDQMGEVEVQLEIFDVLGRKIQTLVKGRQTPGFYTVEWNANGESFGALSSGVYFYRLKTEQKVITRKLTMIN